MLKSLKLTNFRQHRNVNLQFTEGVTVIKGLNESGKSTIFEAISFALFGVRACRNNDITTWGEPQGSHRVDLTFTSGSKTYVLYRSTRGAELTAEDIRVSGQTEVTRYCEQLFGIPTGTAPLLMFASQNTLRGVLDATNSKAAQFVEDLAGFSQIEQWIETLQGDFPVGKSNQLEEALTYAKKSISDWTAELQQYPNPKEQVAQRRESLETSVKSVESQIAEAEKLKAEVELQQQNLADAPQQLQTARETLQSLKSSLAVFEHKAGQTLEEVSDEELQKALENYDTIQSDLKTWQQYAVLDGVEYPDYYQGSKTELEFAVIDYTDLKEGYLREQMALEAELKSLKQSIHTDLFCRTCNRAWDNAKQMEESNREIRQKIEDLEPRLSDVESKYKLAQSQLTRLIKISQYKVPDYSEAAGWEVDETVWPPKFTWPYLVPRKVSTKELEQAAVLIDNLKLRASQYQELKTQVLEAEAQVSRLKPQVSSLMSQVSSLETQVQEYQTLKQTLKTYDNRIQALQEELEQYQKALLQLPEYEKTLQAPIDRLKSYINDSQTQADKLEADLKELGVNNTLLKALRSIKPQVSKIIWDNLCSNISHYFSLMRGTSSVVGREDNGFSVDGNDVSSLSGSTLDVLGLALRVSLTKTFLPETSFLLLDEPFAACDSERQTQALGFVTSVGFNQVIIITHEETTEAVSDYLITL
ncbi:hypothetical protein CRG49_002015 [Neisseria sp. N95_16]|uniref:AAA family ATPase n=1 Tax=Neisseria brasiliensis TaxID=2666100 RepID=A0A7X2H0Q2_9NEIS|nr:MULTISPECIES: AAA family ATPase [Neisseria]MRN38562.1 AAA family ATPase [Neisseria brasiliensis]PJO10481.1 hypothetical protein CRG49_002015 [Neisseria sp. N95_16]